AGSAASRAPSGPGAPRATALGFRCGACSAPLLEVRLELLEHAGPPGADAGDVEVRRLEGDPLVVETDLRAAAGCVGEGHGQRRVLALAGRGADEGEVQDDALVLDEVADHALER